MSSKGNHVPLSPADCAFGKLPDHLLIEIFIRVPISDWGPLSCVKKQWAHLFRQEFLWNAALLRTFPLAGHVNRWPGPIPQGSSKRRYTALYASKQIFSLGEKLDDEIVGHVYLFLKEQLEISKMPPLSGVLHGTIIGALSPSTKELPVGEQNGHSDANPFKPDQILKDVININGDDSRANILEESGEPGLAQITGPVLCDTFMADNVKEINEKEAVATLHFNWYFFIVGWIDVTDDESISFIYQLCLSGKSRDMAHELASIIWLAVVDNLEENEQTFNLLKRLASEGDVILPFRIQGLIKLYAAFGIDRSHIRSSLADSLSPCYDQQLPQIMCSHASA
ncbi:hypothetical protein HAX54_004042 [Datura stramonium]|uniref:F-box domain-containing protein n=1 Tax=Datura stramonium TaxID=4076 RepID=A0ABS8T6C8_DATST|nr:hypothetical protein [Datura stramonium]